MDNSTLIRELSRKFSIPDVAEVVVGNGGLPCVRISSASANGEIYLHGAHVTSWRPKSASEVLFLSSGSRWEDGKAIRGGIPICFPWFGDKANSPTAPAHGFVRTKSWQLDAIERVGGAVTVSLSTYSDETTKQWWDAEFRITLNASFGHELTLNLTLENAGQAALRFEEALHAYFKVADVRQARILGLNEVHFLDKTDHYREKVQQGEVQLAQETDRVYLDSEGPVELLDRALQRTIRVAKQNSQTTVIWNPWADKARTLSDLPGDEWTGMLCIEASNVLNSEVELGPRQQHSMKAVVRVTAP